MKKTLIIFIISITLVYAETFIKKIETIGWHFVGIPIENIEINSTIFSDKIEVVWRWSGVNQDWEFYSNNQAKIDLAKSISIPIIQNLNKGDAIWIKNTYPTTLSFDNEIEFIPTGNCVEDVIGIDTRVLKIGIVGQTVLDESKEWYGVWYKDPDLNLMVAFDRTPAGFSQTGNSSSYCSKLEFMGYSDWKTAGTGEKQMMQYYNNNDNENISAKYKYDIDAQSFWNNSGGKYLCVRKAD